MCFVLPVACKSSDVISLILELLDTPTTSSPYVPVTSKMKRRMLSSKNSQIRKAVTNGALDQKETSQNGN
jgi:hypothetical protein